MNGTREVVRAWYVELERETLVRIHGTRTEQSRVADHRVWLIVHVDPGHGRTGLNLQGRRVKHEFLDHDPNRVRGSGSRRTPGGHRPQQGDAGG